MRMNAPSVPVSSTGAGQEKRHAWHPRRSAGTRCSGPSRGSRGWPGSSGCTTGRAIEHRIEKSRAAATALLTRRGSRIDAEVVVVAPPAMVVVTSVRPRGQAGLQPAVRGGSGSGRTRRSDLAGRREGDQGDRRGTLWSRVRVHGGTELTRCSEFLAGLEADRASGRMRTSLPVRGLRPMPGCGRLGRKRESELPSHADEVVGVEFTPDSRWLVTASMDHTAWVWEVGAWQRVAELRGHLDGVWGVTFSPDGQLVATASVDRMVRTLDTRAWRGAAVPAGMRSGWEWRRVQPRRPMGSDRQRRRDGTRLGRRCLAGRR